MEYIKILTIVGAIVGIIYVAKGLWWPLVTKATTVTTVVETGFFSATSWPRLTSQTWIRIPLAIGGLILVGLIWDFTRSVVWLIIGPLSFGIMAYGIASLLTNEKKVKEARLASLDRLVNRTITAVVLTAITFSLWGAVSGKEATAIIKETWKEWDGISLPAFPSSPFLFQKKREDRAGGLPAGARNIASFTVEVPATGWSKTIEEVAGTGTGSGQFKMDCGGKETLRSIKDWKWTINPREAVLLAGEGVRPFVVKPHKEGVEAVKGEKKGLNNQNFSTFRFQSTTGNETSVVVSFYKSD